ncbi:hypothetical protein DIC66_20495 [Rhodoferax lacus]|uniref:Flagellar protein FlgN n=1 Tax=Rhodoferax lacus TaxID=2184758 RepID=A0A3E1R728_9BURK|nr:hypothetical protein [Rhodoferax lacus]RFO95043.1 hypothetical protein DIC66_20495 [Rhodoferax lacus]
MQNPAIQQLDLVERQFNQVAAFLAAGDAAHLQAAAALLQILSVELARLLPPQNKVQANQAELHRRVLAMAKGLQMLRDNLSRQAAMNLQALKVVVPTAAKSTYSGGTSVYGSVARQSGAFNVLAA